MKNLIVGVVATSIVAFLLGGTTGCSSPDSPPEGSIIIRGAGATFPAPLYEKWIEEYRLEQPAAFIEYEAVGSGAGVDAMLEHAVDFGASDFAMTDEQLSQVEVGVQLVPTAAGSVAIIYNLGDFAGELRLPRDVYADIFMGRIDKWNDPRIVKANPNADLPPLSIAVTARQDSSGTTYAFTNHLSAINEEWSKGPGTGKEIGWPGGAMLAFGNEGVAGLVKRTPGAIGYCESGLAERAGLPMAWLQNKAGNYVQPSHDSGLETLENAVLPANFRAFFPDPDGQGSYPIVTYTWMLLYGRYVDGDKRRELIDFVQWCISDGQKFNEDLGYIRISADTARRVKAAVAGIK